MDLPGIGLGKGHAGRATSRDRRPESLTRIGDSHGLGRIVGFGSNECQRQGMTEGVTVESLTHEDERGKARMVDVSGKPITTRVAKAAGYVRMSPEALAAIAGGRVPKGSVIGTARLAGIMAAKQASALIPLCHPLDLTHADVEILPADDRLTIVASVSCVGRTGAEMEALTAVAVTALTVVDMCKAIDRWMTIGDIRLLEKTGGTSGDVRREE